MSYSSQIADDIIYAYFTAEMVIKMVISILGLCSFFTHFDDVLVKA